MFSFPKNIDPFLKDSEQQQEVEKKGFTVIKDFLNENEINHLKSFYDQHFLVSENAFNPKIHYMNKEERELSNSVIMEIIQNKISQFFFDYKLYACNFIVKSPGKESEKDLHQDMTLLDESKYMGINLWIPLCDVNENNGALYIIPGSHRIEPTLRSHTLEPVFYKHKRYIMKYLNPVFVNAGDLIIFDHSTLHYSPPNFSKNIRIAVTCLLSHKNSHITTCYLDKTRKDKKVELFEHSDNFFNDFTQFETGKMDRPKIGRSIGFIEYNPEVFTPKLLSSIYGKPKNLTLSEKFRYHLLPKVNINI